MTDRCIGAIAIGSATTGGFSDSQVALLQTFAEQAVIAITSAETYRALQTRTSDLQETLEYQTATSDVLKVISRSTFDLQPVLDTLVETAARLCDADQALISRREGEVMHFAANYGFPPEYETYLKARGPVKLDPGSPTVAHRTLIEGRPVHIDDVTAVPGYPEVFIRLGKHRTSLGVPLLRGGDTIGFIQLSRQQVEPFTDRQIALVSTFADQAVIAIENTRLITEQREALEQQTATAEVLQVINASPGNLTPVFEAMLEKAIRLCGGDRGVLWTIEGGRGRLAAARGLPAEFVALLRERGESGTNSPLQRVVQGEWLIEFPDTVEEFSRSGDPHAKGAVEAGVRSAIWVAIVKEGVTVGAFAIGRSVIGTFSDKQIALLQNFAAQAVIAMENARLIPRQREALEQQTATAEVLQVINASPGNLTPVFDAMLEKAHAAVRCRRSGSLATYDGDAFRRCRDAWRFPEHAPIADAAPPIPAQACIRRTDSAANAFVHIGGHHGRRDATATAMSLARIGRAGRWADRSVRAAAQGRCACSALSVCTARRCAVLRQGDRAAGELRRAGGDRDGERAADHRTARGTGAADRDRRGVAGDQRLAGRSRAGVRCDPGEGASPVRRRGWFIEHLC